MADQALTVTIRDAYVDRVRAAVDFFAGTEIKIADKDVKYRFTFSYLPKQGGETYRQYYERFLRETTKAFVRCYELGVDRNRAISAVEAVPPPSQNVPDDIVV